VIEIKGLPADQLCSSLGVFDKLTSNT